ncbi:MAG: hypothetical protein Ct9H90mP4_03010 [Gammaproteobacteria bacterium]|nr:MAG: hypothetical protein Ct9H90mP4_03010 [Gammaproteobacteria bacterium]
MKRIVYLRPLKFEGADSLIQYLESEKIKWCIVTNKPRRFAEKIVKHFFPPWIIKKCSSVQMSLLNLSLVLED